MSFPSTEPRIADSDNNLLFKICQELSNQNGGAHPPRLADSDNNLLFKIAHLVILDGTGDAACTAALATCNLLTASQAATLAANVITIAGLNAQIAANPQNLNVEWTPTGFNLGDNFGFHTWDADSTGKDFTGLTSVTFKGTGSKAGIVIAAQTTLQTLSFPNLTSCLGGFILNANTALTSVSAPLLTSAYELQISINAVLSSVSFPVLSTLTGGSSISNNALVSVSLPLLVSTAGFTINTGSMTSLSLPLLATVVGTLNLQNNTVLPAISLPALTSVTTLATATGNTALTSISVPVLVTYNGSLSLATRTNLTSVNFNSLVSAPTAILFNGCTSLVSLSLPALVTGGTGASGFNANGCTNLTTVSLPNYLPTNARLQNFGTCALTAASVNHILARCVANAAYVSGTITLNGGTNAAPTGQGIIDKATLITRGCTVNTN